MVLHPPRPGQVIRYSYLWSSEARAGRADGTKDRPCAVVLTQLTEAGRIAVYVLPITHTQPFAGEDGVELPQATKRRLGLDTERSWIITTELNRFTWPGPDIRLTPAGEYVYGYLPDKLMRLVLDQVRQRARDKSLTTTPRTE